MFFETPHAIGLRSLVVPAVHALLNNLEFYLLMSNLYILSMKNINIEFWHLVVERDALVENNINIFGGKQDLETLIN